MSNVLIGIIGVILFIGLALAGAVYVGQLVLDGTTQRNAGVVTASVTQTAAAVRMYGMRNRRPLAPGTDAVDRLIAAGGMSARPQNPLVDADYPMVVDANGSLTGNPAFVLMYLGQTSQARDACIEFEIANGHADRTATTTMEQTIAFTSRATTASPGCHRNAGAFGGNGGVAGDYLAYFPI